MTERRGCCFLVTCNSLVTQLLLFFASEGGAMANQGNAPASASWYPDTESSPSNAGRITRRHSAARSLVCECCPIPNELASILLLCPARNSDTDRGKRQRAGLPELAPSGLRQQMSAFPLPPMATGSPARIHPPKWPGSLHS